MYFISSGYVKITRIHEVGKELITHLYRSGEYFGYIPVIRESCHFENAVALSDVEVKLISAEGFKNFLLKNPQFTYPFIKVLADIIEGTEQKMTDIAYSSVRQKVAHTLLEFANTYTPLENEQHINLNISRDNLAACAATAKETLIRTLSDFKHEGILFIEGKNIRIVDKNRLEQMQS